MMEKVKLQFSDVESSVESVGEESGRISRSTSLQVHSSLQQPLSRDPLVADSGAEGRDNINGTLISSESGNSVPETSSNGVLCTAVDSSASIPEGSPNNDRHSTEVDSSMTSMRISKDVPIGKLLAKESLLRLWNIEAMFSSFWWGCG